MNADSVKSNFSNGNSW